MSSSRVFRACGTLMAAAKTSTRSAAAAGAGVKAKKASSAPVRRPSSGDNKLGLQKAIPVSPAMRNFMGVPEIARTDAIKKIWEYIKANSLQNPANKREILCDTKLKTIFDGRDKVGMLEISKLLAPHFIKPT